jgi:hypothetical protein
VINLENNKKTKKNFERGEKENDLIVLDLARVCRGLIFISETDADVEPFVAGIPRSRSMRSYVDAIGIEGQPIEEVAFEAFFERLTAKKDWHGPREDRRTKKFAALRDVLRKHLDDLQVIRAGRIRIDIYIAGIDATGRLIGVRTKALET